jgi:hypothetical protein
MKRYVFLSLCLVLFSCKKDKPLGPSDHINDLPKSVTIYSVNEDGSEDLLEKYTFFYTDSTLDSIWKEMLPSDKVTFKGTESDPAYDVYWGTQSRIMSSYQFGELNAEIGPLIFRLKDNRLHSFIYTFDCRYSYGKYMEMYNTFDSEGRIIRMQGSAAPACDEVFTYTDIAYNDPGQKRYTWLFTGIDDCGEDLYPDTSVYLADKLSYMPVLSFPYLNVGYDGNSCGPSAYFDTLTVFPRTNEFLTYGTGLKGMLQLHLLMPYSNYGYPILDKVYAGKYLLDYDYIFNSDGDVTQLMLTYKKENMIAAQLKYVFTY